jgi:hypothetical protein
MSLIPNSNTFKFVSAFPGSKLTFSTFTQEEQQCNCYTSGKNSTLHCASVDDSPRRNSSATATLQVELYSTVYTVLHYR